MERKGPQAKAARGRKGARPAPARIVALIFEMEEPLNEAGDLIRALRLIGYELEESGDEDEGRSIVAVTRAAAARLDAAQEAWCRAVEAARRG